MQAAAAATASNADTAASTSCCRPRLCCLRLPLQQQQPQSSSQITVLAEQFCLQQQHECCSAQEYPLQHCQSTSAEEYPLQHCQSISTEKGSLQHCQSIFKAEVPLQQQNCQRISTEEVLLQQQNCQRISTEKVRLQQQKCQRNITEEVFLQQPRCQFAEEYQQPHCQSFSKAEVHLQQQNCQSISKAEDRLQQQNCQSTSTTEVPEEVSGHHCKRTLVEEDRLQQQNSSKADVAEEVTWHHCKSTSVEEVRLQQEPKKGSGSPCSWQADNAKAASRRSSGEERFRVQHQKKAVQWQWRKRVQQSRSVALVVLLLLLMPGRTLEMHACDPDMALLPPVDTCQRQRNPNNSSQCLLRFDESHKETFCRHVVTNNYNKNNYYNASDRIGAPSTSDVRLPHCCGHRLHDAMEPAARLDQHSCLRHVDRLLAADATAARLTCHFAHLLTRYDCRQPYSVRTGCADCLEAYKQWVCATLVPHWGGGNGQRLKPCKSLCHRVEQTCPFFLPGDRAPLWPTQYAGEPTFLCLDPNIPETGEQVTHSLHGPPDCCYVPCQGAVCPDPPPASACLRTAHHSPAPPLETCDTPPQAPSANPCVLYTSRSSAAASRSPPTSRSRPSLAILVVLLPLARWHQRTFITSK
ncbi:uncharacterized protein LOC111058646 [Nilaparvata lugens]|uniref:uncharacterized protein LOC111058646 n=1 Tax=Nilaparvata lugens TaxID=108931 RepID=UPI00193D68C2|nr:uncharacterized protein LOC111058646 [Nilaparvata lugens]